MLRLTKPCIRANAKFTPLTPYTLEILQRSKLTNAHFPSLVDTHLVRFIRFPPAPNKDIHDFFSNVL